jgi:hypothetical protein
MRPRWIRSGSPTLASLQTELTSSRALPALAADHGLVSQNGTIIVPHGIGRAQSGSVPAAQSANDFLAGGGELGERIRLHDWAATPLGPPCDWPQPLRSAVSLCVRSQFPIIIHWGWPDLVVLYNDAFIPMIGSKHPSALGTRLFDSWPELRPTIEGMLQTVLTAGKAALAENLLHVYDRHGYLEERYFTVSFNPIMLDSGEAGGSFTFIHNITDKVIGERRLRALRDLAARTGNAREIEEACRISAEVVAENRHDLPFVLLDLLSKDYEEARMVASVGFEPRRSCKSANG